MGRPATGGRRAAAAVAGILRAAAVAVVLWVAWVLALRGTLEAPIALFAAAASTNGYYAAGHLVPAAAAALGLAAAAGLVDGRWWLPRWPVALGILLPLSAYALSDLGAVDPFDARRALLIALAWAAAFFGLVDAFAGGPGLGARLGSVPGPRVLRALALAAVAAGGLRLAVAALEQFRAGAPTQVAWTGLAVAAVIPVRVTATFHNPNVFASACLLAAGAGASLALLPARGAGRVLAGALGWATVACATAALVLSFSRAGYVALALAVVAAALLLAPGTRRAALPGLCAVVVPFALLALRVPGVVFRLHAIGIASGGDVASRFFSWLDTLRVFLAHPLLGAGPEGIQPLYAPFFPLGRFGTYDLISVPGGIDNDPLEWLAETGLFGGLALVGGLALWLRAGLRRWGHLAPERRAVLAPLLAALAGLVLQSLLETTLYMLPVQAVVVVLTAWWGAEAGLVRAVPVRAPSVRGLAVAALAAAALLARGLAAGWPADAAFLRGYQILTARGAAAALPELRRAVALAPGNPRDWAVLADAWLLQADRLPAAAPSRPRLLREAWVALVHALALDPYDGPTWDLAALWEDLQGRGLPAACAEEWAVRDDPYDVSYVLRLEGDLVALARSPATGAVPAGVDGVAALRDLGYATRLLPLALAVDREHQYVHAIAGTEAALAAAESAWDRAGLGPAPRAPSLPLGEPVCRPALAADGLPWPAVRLPAWAPR